MKRLYFSLLMCFGGMVASANHITGGEMYYTLTSQSGNNYTYHVVLNLFRDCFSTGAPLDNSASISIFETNSSLSVWHNSQVPRSRIVHLNLSDPSPCIQNPPAVCYDVGYYEFDVTLPGTQFGYTITYQRCCRIAGINNIQSSSTVGATYTAIIPGNGDLSSGPANNSARFIGADTVAVCANNPFAYDFSAVDADKDSLVYSFCTAYSGGSTTTPVPDPPDPPPYFQVPYTGSFNASSPMGPGVSINLKTGLISGKAPSAGIYIVTVCVSEVRNGIVIATQRKDLQIKVADCSLTTPLLDPQYITCNGFNLTFTNHNANPLINSYDWSFGDGNTSNVPTPTNTYKDTGTYQIKLVVNKGQQCSDSAKAIAKVYPGFFPGFSFSGICLNHPTQFSDNTTTVYGTVNSWNWNYGDFSSIINIQNPTHTYTQTGNFTVQFIVGNSKGCIDTLYQTVTIFDKPPLKLSPKDTLICIGDAVQLNAIGSGTFSWSPTTNMTNSNTASPTVNPSVSTSYAVQLNQDGCINIDTVRVNVVDHVTLQPRTDTTICATDPVQLSVFSDALHYSWTPANTLNDPNVQFPIATPISTTTYSVTGVIGSCSAATSLKVSVVPYPGSNAGPDTAICYNSNAQLHAIIKGSSFNWSPVTSLSDPLSLNPIASPVTTTSYILSVYDHLGCPKAGLDTVVVTVLPKIYPFAGNDTSVVIGEPLQFEGSGGVGYIWQPATGLNHNNIGNPVGVYDGSFDSIKYKLLVYNENGCYDSAYIHVKVFRTHPIIFVPSAFTPNGDGKNDVFRPIAVGITKIEYFSVYNRWGQLVFYSTISGKGWDGTFRGKPQASGTFVWMVKGVDYTGKQVFEKGTVTLIR